MPDKGITFKLLVYVNRLITITMKGKFLWFEFEAFVHFILVSKLQQFGSAAFFNINVSPKSSLLNF